MCQGYTGKKCPGCLLRFIAWLLMFHADRTFSVDHSQRVVSVARRCTRELRGGLRQTRSLLVVKALIGGATISLVEGTFANEFLWKTLVRQIIFINFFLLLLPTFWRPTACISAHRTILASIWHLKDSHLTGKKFTSEE